MADLEALVARLVSIDGLSKGSEPATREMAVNPALNALGWDTFNPDEVAREYSVLDGRVDYCLRLRGRSRVFIEVKRTGTDLSEHQQQLLRYAFQEGVDLGVLTDGLVWWLYLPGGAGGSVWEHRRFFSLDITREPAAEAAASLRRFLGREATASGDALDAAKRAFERLERERRVRGALPQAWEQLVSEPDDLLVELLQDRVSAISGDRPDEEAAVEFLRGTLTVEPTARPPSPRQSRRRRSEPRDGPAPSGRAHSGDPVGQQLPWDTDFTKTRPAAFWLDGIRYEAPRWRDVLTGVCDQLDREAPLFRETVLSLRGRSRAYFSRSRNAFSQAPAELKNGLFVDITLNANSTVRRARDVLIAVRGPQGADSFRIDLR